mgnify:FL=1
MFGWVQFLGGSVIALLGSEAIEDFFENFFNRKDDSEGIPEQTTFGRIAIAIATGLAFALLVRYLRKNKILWK